MATTETRRFTVIRIETTDANAASVRGMVTRLTTTADAKGITVDVTEESDA